MIKITTLLNYLEYINPFKQYNENKIDKKQNTLSETIHGMEQIANTQQEQPIKHLQQKIIVRDKTNLCHDQIFNNKEEALKYIQHLTKWNPDARPVIITPKNKMPQPLQSLSQNNLS